MNETVQVLPLPKVFPVWEHPGISRYPETIRVSFSDGKTVLYRIDADMPHPALSKAFRNIENMKNICIGYEHKEK